MKCIIRGKLCQNADIDDLLLRLENDLTIDLAAPALKTNVVVSALDALGQRLLKDESFLIKELVATGLNETEARSAKIGATSILNSKQLYLKLKRELSAKPLEMTRISVRQPHLEGYMPLGVLGHVASSNDALLPFLTAVEGLLAGNINIVKTATGASDVALELAAALCDIEPKLEPYLYIIPLSSSETDRLKTLFSVCDGLVVWGSEKAVKNVSELAPAGIPIIAWGHRISFAYVTKAGKNMNALEGIAHDACVNEQQACSAPQVVYYEAESRNELLAFAQELATAMDNISPQYPPHEKSQAEQAEITSQTELTKLKEIMGDAAVIEGDGYRIYVSYDDGLESSPLYRSLIVKMIKRSEMIKVLRPFRSYLQTVGLSSAGNEIAELSMLFYRAGVTRLTSAGNMAEGYTGEPHDGVRALTRYVRRVSLENSILPDTLMDMNEMAPIGEKPFASGTPILKKADFTTSLPAKDDGYLLLKSGGSSGKAVYAPHTYDDAQTTYNTVGCAMVAAGITPDDVVMNLFYAGSMYGGFLSIYEGLKTIDAIQLPMAAQMDFEFVVKEIVANGVTVVLGMPSYLTNLFSEQRAVLKQYGGIQKIFYSGEHINPRQVRQYMEDFGVKSVTSLGYGCNELGTIGYVCEYCTGTEHHLLGSMYMEILQMDSDTPVIGGETGRIVLTPFDKANTDINRYEIGDLGRFVTEPCPCSRLAPKFELLGRFGDTFKFATNYVNYNEIRKILAEHKHYTGRLQIVLEYTEKDMMRICVDKGSDTQGFLDALIAHSPEIDECITDNTGIVQVLQTNDFIISSAGGKVRNVVDLRRG